MSAALQNRHRVISIAESRQEPLPWLRMCIMLIVIFLAAAITSMAFWIIIEGGRNARRWR
jgi:hypothetical protein